jgi:hypothetical protein
MARKAYAARTLLEQVGGEVVGDPDGLRVHRTVMVSHLHADALARDDRVEQVVVVDTALGEVALVEFVAGTRADLTHPFDLG